MNVCNLTGNATKDFELRKTNSGKSVTSNTIAVRRDRKDANGEYQTDFIDFVAFEHQADYLTKYAKKGDRLELTGSWQTRKFTDRNGNNRVANELIIYSASCYSKREEAPSQPQRMEVPQYTNNSETISEDDLPF